MVRFNEIIIFLLFESFFALIRSPFLLGVLTYNEYFLAMYSLQLSIFCSIEWDALLMPNHKKEKCACTRLKYNELPRCAMARKPGKNSGLFPLSTK